MSASDSILRLLSLGLAADALRRPSLQRLVLGTGAAEVARALLQRSRKGERGLPPEGRRCAFITGAASGIGLEVVRRFAAAGWYVGLFDVQLEALEHEASVLGLEQCCWSRCDVTSADSVAAAIELFKSHTGGRMDCLFNCAGIVRVGAFESIDLQTQLQQVRVNLDGVVVCTRLALPLLRTTPGSVVISMASGSSLYGAPHHAVYSATKHGIFALTEALALEFETAGIRVCDVYAGYVNTPLLTASDENVPKTSRMLQDRQSWQTPEQVADIVYRTAAATGAHEMTRLHVPTSLLNWLQYKITRADALFSLGVMPAAMRNLVMPLPPAKL